LIRLHGLLEIFRNYLNGLAALRRYGALLRLGSFKTSGHVGEILIFSLLQSLSWHFSW